MNSAEWRAIALQYVKNPVEAAISPEERRRHYESEIHLHFNGKPLAGVERLYRRTVLLEPTTVCAAHCRWCLRGQYPVKTLSEDEIVNAARYFGEAGECAEVDEVLITGGDPLTAPKLLRIAFRALADHAPNIRTIRIGTRVPVALPQRIDAELCAMLAKHHPLWVNVHFNHARELTPEAARACDLLSRAGIPLNNQAVLLKGVNDSVDAIKALCQGLMKMRVRPYYLYQCDPVRGAEHFRTTIAKGIEIIEGMRGHTSGLAVPTYVIDAPGGDKERGTGKTHLLGWVREQAQRRGGYFVLVGLLDAKGFWESTVVSVLDSLSRDAAEGQSQLGLFLTRLASAADLSRMERRAVSGRKAVTREVLDRFVTALRRLDRQVGSRIDAHCHELGLLVRPLINMCVMSPPLIITKEQIDDMVAILREGISRTMDDLRREGVWRG